MVNNLADFAALIFGHISASFVRTIYRKVLCTSRVFNVACSNIFVPRISLLFFNIMRIRTLHFHFRKNSMLPCFLGEFVSNTTIFVLKKIFKMHIMLTS